MHDTLHVRLCATRLVKLHITLLGERLFILGEKHHLSEERLIRLLHLHHRTIVEHLHHRITTQRSTTETT